MTTTLAVEQCGNSIEEAAGLSELFLLRGKWSAPNKGFRQLLGEFGEPHVRNVMGNSAHDFNPATLSQGVLDVLRNACKDTKKAGAFRE